jgi:hypothetical protein
MEDSKTGWQWWLHKCINLEKKIIQLYCVSQFYITVTHIWDNLKRKDWFCLMVLEVSVQDWMGLLLWGLWQGGSGWQDKTAHLVHGKGNWKGKGKRKLGRGMRGLSVYWWCFIFLVCVLVTRFVKIHQAVHLCFVNISIWFAKKKKNQPRWRCHFFSVII